MAIVARLRRRRRNARHHLRFVFGVACLALAFPLVPFTVGAPSAVAAVHAGEVRLDQGSRPLETAATGRLTGRTGIGATLARADASSAGAALTGAGPALTGAGPALTGARAAFAGHDCCHDPASTGPDGPDALVAAAAAGSVPTVAGPVTSPDRQPATPRAPPTRN